MEGRVQLADGAYQLLEDYMHRFPQARRRGTICAGFDPLARPEAFMAIELREPEHEYVRRAVAADRGVVTPFVMAMWVQQNLAELTLFPGNEGSRADA